jgi:hypothetical protein
MITLRLSAGAGVGSSQKGILRVIVQDRAKRIVVFTDKDAVPPTWTAGTCHGTALGSVCRKFDSCDGIWKW